MNTPNPDFDKTDYDIEFGDLKQINIGPPPNTNLLDEYLKLQRRLNATFAAIKILQSRIVKLKSNLTKIHELSEL